MVFGASPNPYRFSNRAALLLLQLGHEIIPVGRRGGTIGEMPILDIYEQPQIDDLDTITLYMNAHNQQSWHQYILGLNPRRIIFNPGAENQKLSQMALSQGIITLEACTLVMLSANSY